MFDIKLSFGDIEISSLEKEDLEYVYNWLEKQYIFSENKVLHKNDFKQRFLEYYINECEFFVKINKADKLIGMLKGNIEFKNPNEVWLSYFLLDYRFAKNGIGSYILNNVMTYFSKECNIGNFYINLKEENLYSVKFWKKNHFGIHKYFSGETGNHIILRSSTMRTLKRKYF